jgi:hypothetical protein
MAFQWAAALRDQLVQVWRMTEEALGSEEFRFAEDPLVVVDPSDVENDSIASTQPKVPVGAFAAHSTGQCGNERRGPAYLVGKRKTFCVASRVGQARPPVGKPVEGHDREGPEPGDGDRGPQDVAEFDSGRAQLEIAGSDRLHDGVLAGGDLAAADA